MGAAIDLIGMILIFVGISLGWLGHHYFGPVVFWLGAAFDAAGFLFIARTVKRQRDIEKILREYQGPGDFGDTHYHSDAENHSEHKVTDHDSSYD